MRALAPGLLVEAPFLAAIATVYLAGTARALADSDAAVVALRALGFEVVVPDGAAVADVERLLGADAVVTLDGWEESPAAGVDVTLAEGLGKPVLSLADALRRDPVSEPGRRLASAAP